MKCNVVKLECPFKEKSIEFGCKEDSLCCELGGQLIVCEEKKKKFQLRIDNNESFYKAKLDDCIEKKKNDAIRCDYIIFNQDRSRAIFLELKGNDLKKAVDQIEASLKRYPQLGTQEKILCIISSRGIPVKTDEQKPEHREALKTWKKLTEEKLRHISSSKLCLQYDGNTFKKGG
ncbi:hypothetical protein [Helicobacter pametensis]|uniref:hypothetical protein n=1 Tax=Helicobacter pametensis TaxID=95149 RepID=UPI00068822B8|nr:hypothetical protein [Helicobacter pametensis]